MKQTLLPEKEAAWRPVYQLGAAAALIAVIVFRRHLSAELTASNGFGIFEIPDPLPVDALDWFMLMQHDKLVGLALLDVFDLVNYLLVGFVFLALYVALRKKDEIAMGAATLFSLIGITVYFCSNQAFAMLFLSEQYAAATTEANRMMFLAAGEALLANRHGTGVYISLFLVLLAGLLVSIVMLRRDVFNKATAITGILANGFGLGYFVVLIFAPAIIWLPPTISAPFRMAWYILIARKLLQLGSSKNKKDVNDE